MPPHGLRWPFTWWSQALTSYGSQPLCESYWPPVTIPLFTQ